MEWLEDILDNIFIQFGIDLLPHQTNDEVRLKYEPLTFGLPEMQQVEEKGNDAYQSNRKSH